MNYEQEYLLVTPFFNSDHGSSMFLGNVGELPAKLYGVTIHSLNSENL
jgi:hypothetical protein